MTLQFILILLLSSARTRAQEPQLKSWVSFRSDHGYEFKLPKCWELRAEGPEEDGPISAAKDILVTEKPKCLTPRRDKSVPNGVSFEYIGNVTSADQTKQIEEQRRAANNHIKKMHDWLIYKELKIEGRGDAIVHVERFAGSHKFLRWEWKIFCPSGMLWVSGPMIENSPPELLRKIEAGELSVPEPENTIISSLKCVTAK
jgi:hypothetical protein